MMKEWKKTKRRRWLAGKVLPPPAVKEEHPQGSSLTGRYNVEKAST